MIIVKLIPALVHAKLIVKVENTRVIAFFNSYFDDVLILIES